ncbi:hypothetical protein [Pectinatus frisingensis]|uniref:hypothetical protein n=1 Tax=Pectinatus frisingensis TaxID=865 RepID=UPI003D800E52
MDAGEDISYSEVERTIRASGYTIAEAKNIISWYYASGCGRKIIDSWMLCNTEIQTNIREIKKYEADHRDLSKFYL